MRLAAFSIVSLLALSHCEEAHCPNGNPSDLKKEDGGGTGEDLLPPRCEVPAAAGLAGKSIVCIDFAKSETINTTGWNLSVNALCPWSVKANALQLTTYSDAGRMPSVSDCGFTLRPINPDEYQNYGNLILAIQQLVDIPGPPPSLGAGGGPVTYQTANINLAGVKRWTATGNLSTAVTVFPISTNGLTSYQPSFNLHADTFGAGNMTGWQIQSIAVIASN